MTASSAGAKLMLDRDATWRWVTFRLEDEQYGVNVMRVREVLRVAEITPVPGAPDYVLGIINLRGNVVTVIDARKRFGLPPKDKDDLSRIIIIEVGSQIAGMLVDSVDEVVDLTEVEVEPAPNVGSEESTRFIQGVATRDQGLLILVDLHRLLSEEEWEEVAAL